MIEVQKTSQYWEFAEGNYQDGFETFFTIINPDQAKTAHATLTLRPDTAAPTYTRICSIAPKGRLTVRTSTLIAGLADPYNQTCGSPQAAAGWTKSPNTGFGTTITSDLPVVAERPMYFKADVDLDPYSSVISGSHNAMGMSETASSWNFAEGVFSSTPGNNWQFYLTLSNPSDKVARVSVALLREEGGMTAPDICRIQPGKRITLKMNARIAGQNEPAPSVCEPTNWGGAIGDGKGYGIVVSAADDANPASPVSIVAERVTYVDSGTVLGSLSAANPAMTIPRISEGNVAGGSPKARSRWMLAEGFIQAQDENNAFQTYLTVANPNAKNCPFAVTYLTRGGPPVVEQRVLGAHTRQTIAVSEPVRNVIANLTSSGIDVAFTIQSTTSACDLIAERPVYFRSGVGAFVNPTDGGHHTMGTTFARTEWRFAEGYLPPSPADPSDAQFLTVMNTSSKSARVHVEFLPDPASGLDIARLDEVVDPKARKTISTNNFLRGTPGWPGTSPKPDISYGMVVSSEPDPATGERAPIIAERPMYWKTGHDVGGVQTKGGTNVLPLHNDGLDLAQVTTNPYTIAEPEVNPFRITRLTGDITATAGQTLVIEAEITPTPNSVELIIERDNNLRVSKVAMVQASPTRWVATCKATGTSATFQVVGKTGNLGVQSAPRRINVIPLAITGRVTGAGESTFTSTAVPHVGVTAVGLTATPAPVTTNTDGYYWIPVPATGDYKLSILPNNHLLEEIAGQTGSDSPRAPGYADMFSNHVTSPDDSEAIAVAGSGQHYDETLPKAGRIFGKITGRATSQISLAGNKVAFSSNRDGNDEIYVMSSDGTGQTRITQDAASDIWPSFSPDGSKIAFVSNRNSAANLEGDYELFVMNSDGTGITQLTFNGGDEFAPAWSPDGTRIAFSRPPGETGNSDIFVVSADGNSEVNLTNSPEADTQPTWTPDSSQIAFVRTVEFLNTAIYVMSSDGASETLLSEQGDLLPSYTPDGSRITFTSFRDGQTEIYAMATDGTNQTRLTTLPGADAGSKYSLDGEKIVFVSNRHNPTDPDSDLDIYSMDADGASQTRITTGALLTSPPSVGPDSAPDEPVLLTGVPVGFYDAASGKAIGVETVSADDGTYEKWLVPGSYYGLVNGPGAQKPLGWNGYAPMWSKGQLFDNANGGNQSATTLPDIGSAERYDEELLPVFPVRGKVIPNGGPGLGDGGSVGSTQAQLPNGRFWPVALTADGNYVYPLPSGQWILSFSAPGYRASYYHSTEDPAQVAPVVVADSGQTLLHQQINPE